jgi:hypothetical protein
MSDFDWIKEHIKQTEDTEGWVYYFRNKFGYHPDESEWFGLNNLREILSLRDDMLDWKGSLLSEWNLLGDLTEHPAFIKKSDLTIITFDEYIDYCY